MLIRVININGMVVRMLFLLNFGDVNFPVYKPLFILLFFYFIFLKLYLCCNWENGSAGFEMIWKSNISSFDYLKNELILNLEII